MTSNTHKIVSVRGGKSYCEFTCHCEKPYMYLWLNTAIDGNYQIKCPHCGHIHYRFVKKGKITDDRHSEIHGRLETICPVTSYKVKRERGKIAMFRERIATEGLTEKG